MTKKEKKYAEKGFLPNYGKRSFGWTGHMVSLGLQQAILGQMTYYLTESVMLAIGMASAILALSRVFDGITDLIAGVIIDHTKSKWGKARPWSLMSIVMWVAVVCVFTVPDMNPTGQAIYVFIMYNMSESVGRTMVLASDPVHMKRAFIEKERINVISTAQGIASISGIAISVLMPIMIKQFGSLDNGWTIIALVYAIPGLLLSLARFFFVPELDVETIHQMKQEEKKNQLPLKQVLKAIFTNKYLLLFIGSFIVNRIVNGFGIGNYYYQYVVGDLAMAAIPAIGAMLGLVIIPFVPKMTEKWGIRKQLVFMGIVGTAIILLPYLAPTNILLLTVMMASIMAFGMPISMLSNVILIQCMQYSEWKNGINIEGVISSVNSFTTKVGNALGALVAGLLLGMAGYSGTLDVQPDSVVSMLKFLVIGAPAIAQLMGAVFMVFYDLEKKLPQIEADLQERKSLNAGK